MSNDPTDHWDAFNYEVNMMASLDALRKSDSAMGVLFTSSEQDLPITPKQLTNAMLESMLIHMRALIEFFIYPANTTDPKNKLDLRLEHLVSVSPAMQQKVQTLKQAYGKTDNAGDPCFDMNKRLAHITQVRGESFVWTPHVDKLMPLLKDLIEDVRALQPTT